MFGKKVYPENLDIKSEHFNIVFATNDIKESLSQLNQKTITEKMNICITHFKLKVIELEEVAIHKDNLCDGTRLTFLQNKLKQFKDKLFKDLEKKKHKKLNKLSPSLSPSLSEISNTQGQWITNLNLTKQDRLNI